MSSFYKILDGMHWRCFFHKPTSKFDRIIFTFLKCDIPVMKIHIFNEEDQFWYLEVKSVQNMIIAPTW